MNDRSPNNSTAVSPNQPFPKPRHVLNLKLPPRCWSLLAMLGTIKVARDLRYHHLSGLSDGDLNSLQPLRQPIAQAAAQSWQTDHPDEYRTAHATYSFLISSTLTEAKAVEDYAAKDVYPITDPDFLWLDEGFEMAAEAFGQQGVDWLVKTMRVFHEEGIELSTLLQTPQEAAQEAPWLVMRDGQIVGTEPFAAEDRRLIYGDGPCA